MEKKYWRPVEKGGFWFIVLLPKNASITTKLTPKMKKKKIGIVGGRVNNYDRAWKEANRRNRKIDKDWVDR